MTSPYSPLLPRGVFPGPRLLWRSGAVLASLGFLAGAFGSHALKKMGVTTEGVQAWGTASHYAIFNGLGLLLLSMHPRFSFHRFAGPAIAVGGLLFSGSIMALVLSRERFKVMGPVTPVGGSVMIAGYIALVF